MNEHPPTIEEHLIHPFVGDVASISESFGARCWLVGGAVRDILLGKPINDFDFAVQGPVEKVSRCFADWVRGTFFWLDEAREQARVVVKRAGLVFDLAPVKGESIEDDLRQRDFTINAMAAALSGDGALIDPAGGRSDLAAGIIRSCGRETFSDDPLRLLRALRFAAGMHFRIDLATWEHIVEHTHLITRVAGERVRDEFFRILSVNGAGHYLFLLDEAGLLTKILPTYCRREGSIEKVSQVENIIGHAGALFPDHHDRVIDLLRAETEAGVDRISLLKLLMLLANTECADRVATHLHLSNLSRRILSRVISSRGHVPAPSPSSGRPFYRYFRDREPSGVETIVAELAAAPQNEILRDRCRELVRYYFTDYNGSDPDLLLTGCQVMEILGIAAGPAVGEAMEALRSAEVSGEVATTDQAVDFLRKKQLTTKEGVV